MVGLKKLKGFDKVIAIVIVSISLMGCAPKIYNVYHDPDMDFSAIETVAVLPFTNLSGNREAAERVRDVLINLLLSNGSIYVIPVGEAARGVSRLGIKGEAALSPEEMMKLAGIIKVDAVITGVLREYGETRSGSASANVISLSLQMVETETGRVVWTASSTKGGIRFVDRLLGGGGKPMNQVTEEAVKDVINKLFK